MEEKKSATTPVPVRFNEERLQRLDELKKHIGVSTRADVIRWLVDNAHIRPASVQFPQPVTQSN